jgi:phosphoglycerate dehydrogenase-like enzyme
MSVSIFVADPQIREGQVQALQAALPDGWRLTGNPQGATAILTEHVDVSPAMLAAAGEALRLVALLSTGKATCAATHVPVVTYPNTAMSGVAELTVTLMLALSRQLLMVARKTKAQAWVAGRDTPILTDQQRYTYNWIGLDDFGTLYRKRVGIVGVGQIGRAVAARLRPFGVRLLYTQRHRLAPDEEAALGLQWRELDDLLRESDFVTLHHRLQEGAGGNDGQFGVREFALMKPTAYFINTARGRLVDEEALVEALHDRRIAGAGLDVFRYEPLPPGHPLLELAGDNVILTPHVAGAPVTEAWQIIAEELVERIQQLVTA